VGSIPTFGTKGESKDGLRSTRTGFFVPLLTATSCPSVHVCRPLTRYRDGIGVTDACSQAPRSSWRDARESVEEVSRFLDHSSLAVTTTYLRRLEGQEDRGWEKVAAAIGLDAR
jgi:hypothetical protein